MESLNQISEVRHVYSYVIYVCYINVLVELLTQKLGCVVGTKVKCGQWEWHLNYVGVPDIINATKSR